MASSLQSALTSLQQNNYVTVVALTAVGYDYVLTFSDEITYIWSKPWTWVSTLFVLVRYFGLLNLTFISLVGSSFLPGPAETCEILMIINGWTLLLFFGAAEFAAVLRVWVMYNRSRLILTALLGLFSLEIIATILTVAVHSDPRNDSAAAIQILNFSFCVVQPTSVVWTKVATVLQIMHGGVVCILAIFQFMRQSLQMYRITKQWQVNQYMSLFVRQGIIYFFAMFLFSLLDGLGISGDLPTVAWQAGLLFLLGYLPMYTLIPRFIISIRKLYARDVQGSPVGGIDTGFGLSSSGRDTVGTAMVFEDVEQNKGPEDVEANKGLEDVEENKGSVDVEENKGSEDVEANKGSEDVEENKGPEDVEANKGLEDNKGSEDVEENKGSVDVEENKGSEDVEENKGPEDVEANKGSEDIEENKGSEDVEENKGSDDVAEIPMEVGTTQADEGLAPSRLTHEGVSE